MVVRAGPKTIRGGEQEYALFNLPYSFTNTKMLRLHGCRFARKNESYRVLFSAFSAHQSRARNAMDPEDRANGTTRAATMRLGFEKKGFHFDP